MIEDMDQLRSTTEGLLRIREEVERLLVDTMDLEAPLPRFTWAQVERQLTELAASEEIRASVRTHVSAHRKQAWAKPPELVLRELFCLAWVMLDEDYRPGVDTEEEGRNDLSLLTRLAVIVAMAIVTAIAFGALMSGLQALDELLVHRSGPPLTRPSAQAHQPRKAPV